MKTCAHCGKTNENTAPRCVECGTDQFKSDAALTPAETTPGPEVGVSLRTTLSNPVTLFRLLIVVSNGAYLLSLLAPYLESTFLDYETAQLLDQHGHGATLVLPNGIWRLCVLIDLAIAVGLYQFSAAARAAFAIFAGFYLAQTILGGVSIASPLVAFLAVIIFMANGSLLALAYITLKERFQ